MLRTMGRRGNHRVFPVVIGATLVAVLAIVVAVVSRVGCPMITNSDSCNALPFCGMGKVDGLHWGCEAQWPASLKPWRWW